MAQLHSLVYVSSATRTPQETDLQHLLQRARERNLQCGVTGVLLFDDGNFMQYIEGPPDGLAEVYRHIERDPLHSGIIELCRQVSGVRLFKDWLMGVRVMNSPQLNGEFLTDSDLESRFNDDMADGAGSASVVLLQGFWLRGRCR